MEEKHFNLITKPWIKVLDENNKEQTVSIAEALKNAPHYRQLAGEMQSQDLVILRLLLAVLLSVYQRVDANGKAYEGLIVDGNWKVTVDPELDFDDLIDELQETWRDLYVQGEFSQTVFDYLTTFTDKFDFFGRQPFYQVTNDFYDAHVPLKNQIKKGNGTVAIKQMNRSISESGNSIAVFTPRSDDFKNQLTLDELVRWLITYQNYTGVTDKTKVERTDKFSVSSGWLYNINPIYAHGQNLFETLMLNLTLFEDGQENYVDPKPVWEWKLDNYLECRLEEVIPDNLPELYTLWSRMLHIEWQEEVPTIFTAGLPKIDNHNVFIEPMTTWRPDKDGYKPKAKYLSTMGTAMWRNFGDYVGIKSEGDQASHVPGIVWWLNRLTREGLVARNTNFDLTSAVLISDGKGSSQMPAAESTDNLEIRADVLFDTNPMAAQRWPRRIEEVIDITQKVGGTLYHFVWKVAELRDLSADNSAFANRVSGDFYERLNEPFLEWLASLRNNQDRDVKIQEWKTTISSLAMDVAKELVQNSSPTDIRGDGTINIFTLYEEARLKIRKQLS